MGGYILLAMVLMYIFYKVFSKIFSFLDSINGFDSDDVDSDDVGSNKFGSNNFGNDDELKEFITMRDAFSIARGENPLDPKAQWKSISDPFGLHDKNN